MKSAIRPSTRRASRVSKPSTTKVTVALDLDQIQIDRLLFNLEAVARSTLDLKQNVRGERFISEAEIAAAEMMKQPKEWERFAAAEILALAPVYRALLSHWRGASQERQCVSSALTLPAGRSAVVSVDSLRMRTLPRLNSLWKRRARGLARKLKLSSADIFWGMRFWNNIEFFTHEELRRLQKRYSTVFAYCAEQARN